MESLSGSAEFVQSRGKRKIGYELNIQVKYKKYEKNIDVSISELCDDLSDPVVEQSGLTQSEVDSIIEVLRE